MNDYIESKILHDIAEHMKKVMVNKKISFSHNVAEKSRAISTNVKYFYQDQPGCAAASANVKLEELKNRCIGSGRWLSWGLFVQITKITPERSHHIPGADIVSVVLYPCSGFLQ